jgi:hypothetical protein
MKGSVVLSLALDVTAVVLVLIPDRKYAWITTDPKRVKFAKHACVVLLVAGFLIDMFISHPG